MMSVTEGTSHGKCPSRPYSTSACTLHRQCFMSVLQLLKVEARTAASCLPACMRASEVHALMAWINDAGSLLQCRQLLWKGISRFNNLGPWKLIKHHSYLVL